MNLFEYWLANFRYLLALPSFCFDATKLSMSRSIGYKDELSLEKISLTLIILLFFILCLNSDDPDDMSSPRCSRCFWLDSISCCLNSSTIGAGLYRLGILNKNLELLTSSLPLDTFREMLGTFLVSLDLGRPFDSGLLLFNGFLLLPFSLTNWLNTVVNTFQGIQEAIILLMSIVMTRLSWTVSFISNRSRLKQ